MIKVTVWGETKTIAEWAADKRCKVSARILRQRLRGQKVAKKPIPLEDLLTEKVRQRNGHQTSAFGEFKSITDWAEDKRCLVSYNTLRERLAAGMDPEQAMTTLPHRRKPVRAWGETKSIARWLEDGRCGGATFNTIVARLQAGQKPEDAIRKPPRRRNNAGAELTAWGETKSIAEWVKDPRCKAPRKVIDSRLDLETWEVEKALSTPIGRRGPRGRLVEAWGESKTAAEWSRDKRCSVSYTMVLSRLRGGWPAEEAVSGEAGYVWP